MWIQNLRAIDNLYVLVYRLTTTTDESESAPDAAFIDLVDGPQRDRLIQ